MKNQKNKYHYSPFERGVGVCYQSNSFIFLIFTDIMDKHRLNNLFIFAF